MIIIILLALFLSCLFSCEKEEMAVFEVEINDSDFLASDLVEIKMTRLGCSVDDLSVESAPSVEWEISYRKDDEIK